MKASVKYQMNYDEPDEVVASDRLSGCQVVCIVQHIGDQRVGDYRVDVGEYRYIVLGDCNHRKLFM